jgi:hypothetical protein
MGAGCIVVPEPSDGDVLHGIVWNLHRLLDAYIVLLKSIGRVWPLYSELFPILPHLVFPCNP